jgi:hypothetical protein
VKAKEMLGLMASMVLRCDGCISYHLGPVQGRWAAMGRVFLEVFSVALVAGGSIVIPHLRRAVDLLDQLESGPSTDPSGCADHA